MKKLKLKLWRIKNIVLMEVLEQDESLRGKGEIFESYNCKILSVRNPHLTPDKEIYIRGTNTELDNRIAYYDFGSTNEAKSCIRKIIDTVRAYNASVSTEPITDDIETFIVE